MKRWALLVLVLLVGAGVTIALTAGGESDKGKEAADHEPHPAWAKGKEVPNAGTERAREGVEQRQARFERGHGKEADRQGPTDPAMEQVENRAYPHGSIGRDRAAAARKAFTNLPGAPSRSSFDGASRAFRDAVSTAGTSWTERGPKTPNVAGEDSQFIDPVTAKGPATQESGRVTALAVDPACTAGNCRVWIAAAGGGIWRTNDALAAKPTWIAPPSDLPTNSFGSIIYDAAHHTLYAGSGEPSGSSDSEAGIGLFKSTDGGASWSLVPGSASVATNRAIGAIAIDPSNPQVIYMGTGVARHGMASVWGARRSPPNAPPVGLYKSTNGGQTFQRLTDLAFRTPPDPTSPDTGNDFFAGGITKVEFDPNDSSAVYASVLGYGIWRSTDGGSSWSQVFHTMNQNDFGNADNPGDSTGDITQFDLVDLGATTRAYVGDASDDWATDDASANTPLPEAWRIDDVGGISGDASGQLDNSAAGWIQLSNETNGKSGFGVYGWCQNGQCSYDSFVAHPAGAPADTVWYGGSMNYDELKAYDQDGLGAPPRSNGRAVIRSTNAGAGNSATANETVTWKDMTAVLGDPTKDWDVKEGIHPDLHTIGFADQGRYAFIGSDGGIVRIDTHTTQNQSASCDQRQYAYNPDDPTTTSPLQSDDLTICHMLLAAVPASVTAINDGLADLQFQSVSANPTSKTGDLLGGTQDNGTWALDNSTVGLETVGGDGGQSGFDSGNPTTRFHNYYDATPEVNFHGNDPKTWLDIYDPLQVTAEARSFYTPFRTDPKTPGRVFTGLEHVWRTDDNGGNENDLVANGCYAVKLDPFRADACGDWVPIGANLTDESFGASREGEFVAAVERAPTDTGTLWAATRTGRLFVTSNADDDPVNVVFHRIDTPQTPGRFVSGIAIDPSNPNVAFISYSGYDAYTPDTPGHVFQAVYNPATHSATFTDRSANIGDQPVTDLVRDPGTGDLYASTDFGILRLPAGGSQWVDASQGLPKVTIYGLTVAPDARILLAATHGRGIWSLALPKPPTPPGKPSGSISGPARIQLEAKATYTATGSTPNGGSVRFRWSLPGRPSTATGAKATFTPSKLGRRSVILTVSDDAGQSTVVQKTVTVIDTRDPKVSLAKVAPVTRGKRTTVRGQATDAGGIRSAKLSYGDGTRVRVKLGKGGRFTAHHTYRKAGTYTVTFAASDPSGNLGDASRKAKVVKPKPRRKK